MLEKAGDPPRVFIRDSAVTLDLRSAPGVVSWLPREAADPGSAAPCVVLADRAGRGEFAALQAVLHRIGVPSVRFDTAAAARGISISISPDDDAVMVDGRRIVPSVVWARDVSPRSFPADPAAPAASMIRADSWSAAIHQLRAFAPATVPAQGPGRLEQLAGAARAGIRTPRTILTTDPAGALAEIASRKVVVKVAGEHFTETAPGLLHGVFAQVLDREEIAGWPALDHPVLVQEHVEHDEELRVYFLGGQVHAFAVTKSSPDAPWRDEASVSVRYLPAPRAAVEAVHRLAGLWNLTYGAFDLLPTASGQVVFLEVNVDGDWRWFESRAGVCTVSAAAARMVRGLHRRALPDDLALPPIGILDLLSVNLGPPGGTGKGPA